MNLRTLNWSVVSLCLLVNLSTACANSLVLFSFKATDSNERIIIIGPVPPSSGPITLYRGYPPHMFPETIEYTDGYTTEGFAAFLTNMDLLTIPKDLDSEYAFIAHATDTGETRLERADRSHPAVEQWGVPAQDLVLIELSETDCLKALGAVGI